MVEIEMKGAKKLSYIFCSLTLCGKQELEKSTVTKLEAV